MAARCQIDLRGLKKHEVKQESGKRQPDANSLILVYWQLEIGARYQFDLRVFKTIKANQETGRLQPDANSQFLLIGNWRPDANSILEG